MKFFTLISFLFLIASCSISSVDRVNNRFDIDVFGVYYQSAIVSSGFKYLETIDYRIGDIKVECFIFENSDGYLINISKPKKYYKMTEKPSVENLIKTFQGRNRFDFYYLENCNLCRTTNIYFDFKEEGKLILLLSTFIVNVDNLGTTCDEWRNIDHISTFHNEKLSIFEAMANAAVNFRHIQDGE